MEQQIFWTKSMIAYKVGAIAMGVSLVLTWVATLYIIVTHIPQAKSGLRILEHAGINQIRWRKSDNKIGQEPDKPNKQKAGNNLYWTANGMRGKTSRREAIQANDHQL